MCLLDTIDGALMMAVYSSSAMANDHIAILYYSIVLTAVTIFVALAIGILQVLSLVLNTAQPSGKFWVSLHFLGSSLRQMTLNKAGRCSKRHQPLRHHR